MKITNLKQFRATAIKVVLVSLLIYAVSLPFIVGPQILPIYKDLQFNAYALLSLLGAAINFVLLIAMFRRKVRSDEGLWIMMFIASAFMFAVSEIFLRCATTVEINNFWATFYSLGGVFIASSAFLFALHYTQPDSRHARATVLLILGAGIIAMIETFPIIFDITITGTKLYPWGFVPLPGPAFLTVTLWIYVLVGWSIGKFLRFRKHTTNPTLKKQSMIYAIGLLAPAIASMVGDIGLPGLGYNFIPLTVLLFSVTGVIFYIGLTRYHIFSFSPALFTQQVLATMNESVIVTNNDFQVEFINESATKFLQLSTDTVKGKSIDTILEKDITKQIKEYVTEHANPEPIELDVAVAAHTIPVSLISSHIATGDTVQGHVLVFRDISNERAAKEVIEQEVIKRTEELHEEQAKFRASVESLPLGFFLVDTESKVLIQNKALKTILELDGAAESLADVSKGLHDFDLAAKSRETQASGKVMEINDVAAGSKILHFFLAPVFSKDKNMTEVIGTVVLLEDVTERKIMERSKDEFFSIASHELRTPLTSIKGNASMILDYYKEILSSDEALEDMVGDMHKSAIRLIDIVNDFLDLSRLEQGKVVFKQEEFKLDAILENVIYEMRPVLSEKKLRLEYDKMTLDKLPAAWGDGDRFKQVIYNLIGNAAKFTDEGSIDIKAHKKDDMIEVTVTDSGRGMSEASQKLLFRKFQQAGDSLLTRDTTRGTGLGLYISKMLIERMGGEAHLVRSEVGKGSTFSVTIPMVTDKLRKTANHESHNIDTITGIAVKDTTNAAETDKSNTV